MATGGKAKRTVRFAVVGLMVMACVLAGMAPSHADDATTPPVYLGLDSYLHWDKLPYLEVGDRVGGQSSADTGGSNNDNVNTFGPSPFNGGRVLLDQAGPGVVTFMRLQENYGGPWAVRNPLFLAPLKETDLGQTSPTTDPAQKYPYPLSLNGGQSQGSSIVASSIPYASTMQFMSSAANGNFYSMYRKLPVDMPLPTQTDATASQVAALLRTAGTDIAPKDIPTQLGTVALPTAGAPVPLTSIDGQNQLRAIKFHVPFGQKVRFGNSRLQIYWDGETTPSVDAPIKYLTGDGAGVYQPAGRQLVAGLPANITSDGSTYMDYSLYWPMPFGSNARIVVIPSAAMDPVSWSVRYEPFTDPLSWVGKFHANYVDVPSPQRGQDMTFLDYQGSGKLVGTVINFGTVGGTLEGDPHIYLDGSKTPQIAVTGTEEWGMGGNYWRSGKQTSLPMAGLPSSTNNPAGSDIDGAAEYRYLISDSIPFNNHITVNWEHGSVNDNSQPYKATMLWYGTPTSTAVHTDQVSPGSPGYVSPSDQIATLTAAYEQTVNSPLVTNPVAQMTTSSTLTMALDGANAGAYLRRTFNSCVANQRAKVFVDGQPAGTWYNAGVSSKTGFDGHDRCWRDDDFPLPKSLTAGKTSITIRIDNDTLNQPSRIWTASTYQLFSFV